MSANSPAFYTTQYASAVELLSQQKVAKIAPLFMQMTGEGVSATVVDQVDAIEADERTTRYDDITPGDPAHTRPWVFPRSFDKAVFFDTFDKMRMNADPTSTYVEALVAAINRKADDECIRAFFDARIVGQAGTTSENFPSANQVGVNVGGTASGMNVEKLQTVLRFFEENEVDLDTEQVCVALSPTQAQNLGNEIEVISSDFYGGYMRTRKLDGFLTIRYILTNRLQVDGSGYRRCPAWTASGMSYATWGGGMMTDVSQRKDKRGMPWQAYVQGNFGAVRRDNKRVFEIKCA
jgi:hypothetical protein